MGTSRVTRLIFRQLKMLRHLLSPALRNGSANRIGTRGSRPNPASAVSHRRIRSDVWAAIGIVGLAQAAAVLLVVGISWQFFVSLSARPQ